MTLLVGDSNTASYTNTDPYNGANRMQIRLFTASQSGTATSLNLYVSSWQLSTGKLCIFDSSGNLLANTTGLNTGAPGVVGGAISSVSITSGSNYYLGFILDSQTNQQFFTDSTLSYIYAPSNSFTTPASFLTSSIVTDNGYHRFMMYADGTAGSNTGVTPNAGSDTIAGNTPTVTAATNTIVTPITAERRILIPPERKIFLPARLNRAA